jgi:hypothetical protein
VARRSTGRTEFSAREFPYKRSARLFWAGDQVKYDRAGGIAKHSYLSQALHAVAKIGEDGNEHGEILVHCALRDWARILKRRNFQLLTQY